MHPALAPTIASSRRSPHSHSIGRCGSHLPEQPLRLETREVGLELAPPAWKQGPQTLSRVDPTRGLLRSLHSPPSPICTTVGTRKRRPHYRSSESKSLPRPIPLGSRVLGHVMWFSVRYGPWHLGQAGDTDEEPSPR